MRAYTFVVLAVGISIGYPLGVIVSGDQQVEQVRTLGKVIEIKTDCILTEHEIERDPDAAYSAIIEDHWRRTVPTL